MITAGGKIPSPPKWPFTPRPGRKPRVVSGLLLSLLGWGLSFIAIPTLFLLLASLDQPPDWLVGPGVPAIRIWLLYILGVLVLVLSPFSVRIITMGRQLRQEDALVALTRDKRAPILLLRSFLDDTLFDPSVQSGEFIRTRYEDRLGAALRGLGPVIVGCPVNHYRRLERPGSTWRTGIGRPRSTFSSGTPPRS